VSDKRRKGKNSTFAGHGDLFCVLGRNLAGSDILNPSQRIGRIVPVTALVTDSDFHVLENDETVLVLEGFTLDASCSYGSFTVLASIIEFTRHFKAP
jgi:hypothetical protein